MTTAAAARLAGVTTRTIQRWCAIGAITARRVGRRWVIQRASLLWRLGLGWTLGRRPCLRQGEQLAGDEHHVPARLDEPPVPPTLGAALRAVLRALLRRPPAVPPALAGGGAV